jgi:hypothetical protein
MAPVTHITLGVLNQLIDQELPKHQDRGDQEVQLVHTHVVITDSDVQTEVVVSQEVGCATATTTVVIIQMNDILPVETVPHRDLGDHEQLRVLGNQEAQDVLVNRLMKLVTINVLISAV